MFGSQNLSSQIDKSYHIYFLSAPNQAYTFKTLMSCVKGIDKIAAGWECSGSVVECLTRDRGAAGSSLTALVLA